MVYFGCLTLHTVGRVMQIIKNRLNFSGLKSETNFWAGDARQGVRMLHGVDVHSTKQIFPFTEDALIN